MKAFSRVALALLVAAPAAAHADARLDVPGWLAERIDGYEQQEPSAAPVAIWRINYRGRPSYFVVAPCCDHVNTLLDANGGIVCHPNGGHRGRGDERCPDAADTRAEPQLVWLHPKQAGPRPLNPLRPDR